MLFTPQEKEFVFNKPPRQAQVVFQCFWVLQREGREISRRILMQECDVAGHDFQGTGSLEGGLKSI